MISKDRKINDYIPFIYNDVIANASCLLRSLQKFLGQNIITSIMAENEVTNCCIVASTRNAQLIVILTAKPFSKK
jgi:hypothetical protein